MSGDRPPRERKPVPAYQRALGLLVRREHSTKELRRKLGGRGVDLVELDEALETLQRQGFQDDRRYAEALIRSRALVGHGPARVRAELRANGVPASTVDEAFSACEVDWLELAHQVAARNASRVSSRASGAQPDQQKLLALLLRRGFSHESARSALRALGASVEASDSGAEWDDAAE